MIVQWKLGWMYTYVMLHGTLLQITNTEVYYNGSGITQGTGW